MPPMIDHVAVSARDAKAAARWLAGILGVDSVAPDGPDGDMFSLGLAGSSVLFVESDVAASQHVAFRVGVVEFDAVIERLRQQGLPFGNDPEQPDNGLSDDPLGGRGRVYFISPDRHFFEVTAG